MENVLLFNCLFSVLNSFLRLLKVGFMPFFLFKICEKKNKLKQNKTVLVHSITILLKTLVIPIFLTLFRCNLLESF